MAKIDVPEGEGMEARRIWQLAPHLGAALGAILFSVAKTLLTGWAPDAWLFALGGIFVFVTLAMPNGVLGAWNGLVDELWRLRGMDPDQRDRERRAAG